MTNLKKKESKKKKRKRSCFKQPLWQFKYRFRSLQDALKCNMKSLSTSALFTVQIDGAFRVYEVYLSGKSYHPAVILAMPPSSYFRLT